MLLYNIIAMRMVASITVHKIEATKKIASFILNELKNKSDCTHTIRFILFPMLSPYMEFAVASGGF